MRGDGITRYIVTVHFHEESLAEINELNNQFTRAGFLLTLTDDEGKVHDLGINTFGLISPLNEKEVNELASGLADRAVTGKTDIRVTTWDAWQKEEQ